ncbi:MAG: amidohydrolase family protein [Woeseiaceae bacterium]|nr:amidohydrolase family protein [Woeseiaceae bacterium]
MPKRSLISLVLVLLFAQANAESLAIVNVNVVPMTSETVLRGQTVLIEGETIAAIGDVDAVAVAEGVEVIDGTDRYLMPGLFEMHGHVTGTEDAEIERLFNLFLANGVTSVRGMLGRPAHLTLRADIEAGAVLGPRLITSGPSLNGNSVESAEAGRRMAREQHEAGYDFLKIHPGLSSDEFNAIADTANELGIPFAGHVPVSVGLEGALAKGIATIDHLDGYMAAMLPANVDTSGGYGGFFGVMLADQVIDAKLDDVVAATVAAGVANVPTESLFEQLVNATPAVEYGSQPEMRYMPEGTVSQWVNAKEQTLSERGFDPAVAARAIDIRRRLISALHEAGGVLLLGSDAPQIFNVPGFSLHNELEFMVAAGLTPYEALRTGTVAPAEFLGIDAGSVEVGRIADLVLLDDDPLAAIDNSRRVHGVFVRGRWALAEDLLSAIR